MDFFAELFIDEVITHMKIELEQECDYQREAECARIMRKFLRGYPDYYVPRVIDDLSEQPLAGPHPHHVAAALASDDDQHSFEVLFRVIHRRRRVRIPPGLPTRLFRHQVRKEGLL